MIKNTLDALLGFFGLGGALSPKRISQASKLACNPFAQPEVRMREMQRLLKQGTQESISGAVRRFAANAQGHIADEEEKSWLMDALVDLGDQATEPLARYIASEQKLTYSLLAYQRIVGDAAARDHFLTVLQAIGPGDHQRIEAKQQLVAALVPHAHEPPVQEAMAASLKDHSDDVIWAALDGVEHALAGTPQAPTGALGAPLTQALTALLTTASVSARISRRVADLLARMGAPLQGLEGALPTSISEQYFLDGKGILHARASA